MNKEKKVSITKKQIIDDILPNKVNSVDRYHMELYMEKAIDKALDEVEKITKERVLEIRQWNITRNSEEEYKITRGWQNRIIIEFEDKELREK